eukprot:TRINITY_DN1308_c0_g1_i5.p2 TRINITY_DN1308_c0_g1~~TRINITY_DN1308_c0_g1_i5.p2  ORF type:complete len:204 (-),score=-2.47 TRINITY_DN1308_c0_g1_i5:23-634(-)
MHFQLHFHSGKSYKFSWKLLYIRWKCCSPIYNSLQIFLGFYVAQCTSTDQILIQAAFRIQNYGVPPSTLDVVCIAIALQKVKSEQKGLTNWFCESQKSRTCLSLTNGLNMVKNMLMKYYQDKNKIGTNYDMITLSVLNHRRLCLFKGGGANNFTYYYAKIATKGFLTSTHTQIQIFNMFPYFQYVSVDLKDCMQDLSVQIFYM